MNERINPIDARRRLDYIFRNDLDILEKFSKYIPSIHADLHSEPQDIDIFELALFFRRIQNQIGKSAFHEFANVLVWYFQFGTMDWVCPSVIALSSAYVAFKQPTMHRHLMYLMRYREDLQQRFNAFLSQQHVAVCMADIAKLVEHELEEGRNTSRELLWMIYKIKVKRHVDSRVFGAFYSLVSSPWLNEVRDRHDSVNLEDLLRGRSLGPSRLRDSSGIPLHCMKLIDPLS